MHIDIRLVHFLRYLVSDMASRVVVLQVLLLHSLDRRPDLMRLVCLLAGVHLQRALTIIQRVQHALSLLAAAREDRAVASVLGFGI